MTATNVSTVVHLLGVFYEFILKDIVALTINKVYFGLHKSSDFFFLKSMRCLAWCQKFSLLFLEILRQHISFSSHPQPPNC